MKNILTVVLAGVDPPPAGQDDKSLTDLYSGLYKAGLESLKRTVEGAK